MCVSTACVKEQTFLEVTQEVNFPGPADGLLGMAFTELSGLVDIPEVVTVFETMIKEKTVDKPVFSFYLNRDVEGKMGGELTLGGSDPEHYTGEFTYIPLSQASYWEIKITGYVKNV